MTWRSFRFSVLALAGLLTARVALAADTTNVALAKSQILEGNVAYLRVSHVTASLPDEVSLAFRAFTATNRIAGAVPASRVTSGDDVAVETGTNLSVARKLPPVVADKTGKYVPVGTVAEPDAPDILVATNGSRGMARSRLPATNRIAGTVLDLRFADGDDAAAATATANLLALKKRPLAILVNSQTRDAAVTLATALRKSRSALIFGNAAASEVKPDIAVKESPADEKKFFENPYAAQATNVATAFSGPNNFLLWVDHTSEADLVRAKIKDGDEFEHPPPPRAARPQKPVIRDPVLARAVDLIKGLAIVGEYHP